MRKIKVGVVFLCFMIIFNTFSLALENVVDENKVTMTLDEAVEYALKHNSALLDADLDDLLEDQEDLYNDAKITCPTVPARVIHIVFKKYLEIGI